jgi:hypothetical protein
MSDAQGHRRDSPRPCRDVVAAMTRPVAAMTRPVAAVTRPVAAGNPTKPEALDP